MYTLINCYTASVDAAGKLPECENCTHPIRNVYIIRDENGNTKRVGSDCVVHLLASIKDQQTAELLKRRRTRAAAQWRKQDPQPLTDETREEYINRRVVEMGNALTGWHLWHVEYAQRFEAKWLGNRWSTTYGYRVVERAKKLGLTVESKTIIRRHIQRIEQRTHANAYDFQRPIWDVRKL